MPVGEKPEHDLGGPSASGPQSLQSDVRVVVSSEGLLNTDLIPSNMTIAALSSLTYGYSWYDCFLLQSQQRESLLTGEALQFYAT